MASTGDRLEAKRRLEWEKGIERTHTRQAETPPS